MPRVALTPETIVREGLAPTYTAADETDGHEFLNTRQNVMLHVRNEDVSPTTITIITQQTVDGLALADRAIVVAAGTDVFIGPFSNIQYGTADKLVEVDVSNETDVFIAALIPGNP